jgi:hypothetical protein
MARQAQTLLSKKNHKVENATGSLDHLAKDFAWVLH